MSRAKPYGAVAALVMAAVAVPACKKAAPATSAPMDGAADSAMDMAGDDFAGEAEEPTRSLDEMADDLDRLTDELEGLAGDGPTPESTPEEERCDRICSIAEATCDLSEQICELADAHEGEARYTQACDRAGTQCTDAGDACSACRG